MRKVGVAFALCCLVVAAGGFAFRRWWAPRTPESFGPPVNAPQLKTASTHPMKYYVSLPSGWTKDRTWPVVVTVAGKGWLDNAVMYAQVRDGLRQPFIVVTPEVLANGGRIIRD